jgi:hypothetical protein
MKTIIILVLSIALVSCSSKTGTKVSPDEYLNLNKINSSKHKACIQHRSKILEKPIKTVDVAELGDELYFFVRDEKSALFYIENFDLSKFTMKENQQEHDAIVRACVTDSDSKYVSCDSSFTAFKFFRGLIYGMNQYAWSQTTINKAQDITLKYIEYVAQSDSSLMDLGYANDLLMRLAQKGYLEKSLYAETAAFKIRCEDTNQELRKNISKLQKKKITCDDIGELYMAERTKAKEMAHQLLLISSKTK